MKKVLGSLTFHKATHEYEGICEMQRIVGMDRVVLPVVFTPTGVE